MTLSTNGGTTAQEQPPMLSVLAQYVKDFSFENPNAPATLMPSQQQPAINININVEANPLQQPDIEVVLKIDGKAEMAGRLMFSFEIVYAGVFRLQNIPEANRHPVVLIECPRLLFPFAREIVAAAVRQGGYPPLLLEPIDFASLYQRKMAEFQTTAPTAPTPAG